MSAGRDGWRIEVEALPGTAWDEEACSRVLQGLDDGGQGITTTGCGRHARRIAVLRACLRTATRFKTVHRPVPLSSYYTLRKRGFGLDSHGPYRDRTCDLGIKSPLLYQLS
jgi:hypothetical protein